MTLSVWDWGIIGLYFVLTLWLGLKAAYDEKKDSTQEEDYFVAGRRLGWLTIGASLFASNISSEHLIGLAADGFRTGLGVGNYEWGASLILLLLAAVFVPFYVGSKIRTMPEFLEKRYGEGAKIYLSLVTIVANVLVRISVALYAGGLVIEQMFGVNMWVSIIFLSIATVAYTAAGGLRAVVYTDSLQAVVLLFGTALLSWLALDQVGGWEGLKAQLPASHFDMIKPASDPEMPWVGLILGVPVLGVWYWCTDQVIVQRVLGAKDIQNARMGALFAAFLKILPVFLFVLPGLCGRVLFPEVDSKIIFPTLIDQILPFGVKGLVSAALVAALMSSIDSTLNSTGTLISLDFYQKYFPDSSSKKIVSVGRWTTVIVMIFGIFWVLVVQRAESLFQYLQEVNGAISPPIAAVFLFGVFWKRANHKGAMSALLGGLSLGILMVLNNNDLLGVMQVPSLKVSFLIGAGVNFAISIGLLVVVSLLTPAPGKEKVENLTWATVSSHIEGEVTAKQLTKFRVLSILLLLIMAVLWITFR